MRKVQPNNRQKAEIGLLKSHKDLIVSQLRSIVYCFVLMISISSCKIFKTKNASSATHRHEKSGNNTAELKTNKKAEDIIILARNYTGVPYKMGGTTTDGMDCSGLIYTVSQKAGLVIPRISYQQAEIGTEVELEKVVQGDLVFFNTAKNSNKISHVGLVTEVAYPQKIIFIHSSTSKGVREDNLFSDYWKKAFVKATRPFVF